MFKPPFMFDVRNIDFTPELTFQTSRSGGKGGQHANKVETRVELFFDVQNSQLLEEDQKKRIWDKLGNRINKEGQLQVVAEDTRSQRQNKELAIERFYELIAEALRKPKKRKKTKPPKKADEQRLQEKKEQAEKKELRQDRKKFY